jgi:hypothetical protein
MSANAYFFFLQIKVLKFKFLLHKKRVQSNAADPGSSGSGISSETRSGSRVVTKIEEKNS